MNCSECHRDAIFTCKHDYNLRFCNTHYKNHLTFNGEEHEMIVINDLIEGLTAQGIEIIKINEKVRNSIISKSKKIIEIIQTEVDSVVSKIHSKTQEIEKFLKNKNFDNEVYKKFQENIEIEYKGKSIDSFNKVIRRYLGIFDQPTSRIVSYDLDSDPNSINYIDQNRVVKENPPFIANHNNHFQICMYKGKLDGNQDVAVKFYKAKAPNEDFSKITKEIKIYERLSKLASGENCFLKYYGTFIESGNIVNMVMEYYPKNLMQTLNFLKNQGFMFTEELIAPLFLKLLNSFAEMENLGIYHRDINPQNMLVDDSWNIKIIDFSCSLVKNKEPPGSATGINPIQGAAGYRAPEAEEEFKQGNRRVSYKISKADVFSLGIVFLELALVCPILGLNTKEKNPTLIQLVETVPFPWTKELLKNMLDIDPKKRSRFSKLYIKLKKRLQA
jgi:serine/threonine protein kinase